MPLLIVLACACFVGSFSIRMIDPLVPEIAADLATAEANVSLLASAFAIPYALVQPILGPLGDRIGKTRVIRMCLLGLTIATALTVVATSIEVMVIARILGGLAGGGIIPLALAVVGDRVAMERRQVALSQLLTASIGAILAGTLGTGVLASFIGWRGVFAVATAASCAVFLVALIVLKQRSATLQPARERAGQAMMKAYANVFANPRASTLYIAVFCEGILIIGLLPFVASLLAGRGGGGTFEAGLVLAGFAVGGLFYAQVGSRLLGRIGGRPALIRIGAALVFAGYLAVSYQGSWPFEMIAFAFVGLGFYSVHNSLQTEATELAPENRGAAVALFAFFLFLGQAVGPAFYALAFGIANETIVIAGAGVLACVLALVLAWRLQAQSR